MDSLLRSIVERNSRVEKDKAWEGSWTRKLIIMFITYVCAASFMYSIDAQPIFLNALVPVLGYFLSTLTLPPIKKLWIKQFEKTSLFATSDTYEHYKGKRYRLIGIAKNSETLEDYVVYKALCTDPDFGEGQLWIRPKDMFFGTVEVEGKEVERFRKINP